MIEKLLTAIENLDKNISDTNPEEAEQFVLLVNQRATSLNKLNKADGQWLPSQTERLAAIGRATGQMQERFHFLRGHAVEDMGLLQRHDQLLHLMLVETSNPCYVDYSG